jgi:hypothetical protein
MTRTHAWLVGGALLATMVAMLIDGLPLRQLIIPIGLLAAPGLAIGLLAGIREPLVLALVTLPIGVSVVGLISSVVVYLGAWSTALVTSIVVALTILSAMLATRERSARAALLGLGLLPGIVLLAAELSSSAR